MLSTVDWFVRNRLLSSAGMILSEKRCRLTDLSASWYECVMIKCKSK